MKASFNKNIFDGQLQYGAKQFHNETKRTGSQTLGERPADGVLTRFHKIIVKDTERERYQRFGDFWEDVDTCTVCGSTERKRFVERMGLEFWRCLNCTHGFQSPRITSEKAIEFYSDDTSSEMVLTSPIQKKLDLQKYQYGLDLISEIGVCKKEKIMDIGCGAGGFVKLAPSDGWKFSVGIDANSLYQTEYKNTESVQFINADFDELSTKVLGDGYDCITMWNVLEHLYDLNKIVDNIKNLLKSDGLVFIMVPNSLSLATRLMRNMSPTFSWKHVSHFTEHSLTTLFANHGFKCEFKETVISEIDNIKSYMSGEYPYHGYGDPDQIFDFITPDFIHENMLGSRLIGIFRNDK